MEVTVFGTKTCGFCKVEKQWLESKNIKYKYVDIDEEEEAKLYLQDILQSVSVPVTVIVKGDPGTQVVDIVRGFNRPLLSELLGI